MSDSETEAVFSYLRSVLKSLDVTECPVVFKSLHKLWVQDQLVFLCMSW